MCPEILGNTKTKNNHIQFKPSLPACIFLSSVDAMYFSSFIHIHDLLD